jgi:putative oxidoreductase
MNVESTRYTEISYALMRVMSGLLFACHGAQKLLASFGGKVDTSNTLMLVAGVIELGGGLLMAVGLFTRVAAFIASGEMAVAYFMAHAPAGFWPIENKGELAVAYCFVFLFIAAAGGGQYSLDAALRRRS